jgi:gamma-glutamyl hercynylcysteine S-oxide hydrolase
VCRHLAYVGEPVRLGALLVDPPHSLYEQAWQPRHQDRGVVNADGFGVGWYVPPDPQPARHRGDGPMWIDETFADLARVIWAPAILAAVRSATTGMPGGTAAAAPFRRGRYLFSHNGSLSGWPSTVDPLAAALPPQRLLSLDAATDSALLWALVAERLDAGRPLGEALVHTVRAADHCAGGRLNLLVTDGEAIAATRWGASLWWSATGTGVVVASEPHGDEAVWREVPDRHLLIADHRTAEVVPIAR